MCVPLPVYSCNCSCVYLCVPACTCMYLYLHVPVPVCTCTCVYLYLYAQPHPEVEEYEKAKRENEEEEGGQLMKRVVLIFGSLPFFRLTSNHVRNGLIGFGKYMQDLHFEMVSLEASYLWIDILIQESTEGRVIKDVKQCR